MADTTSFDWQNALGGAILGGVGSIGQGLTRQQIGQGGQTGQNVLQGIATGQVGPQINQAALSSYNNPYLDQNIANQQRLLTENFQSNVLPQIQGSFSNAGSFGSGRQAALTGQATKNFTQQLTDADVAQRNRAYEAAYTTASNYGQNQFAAQQNAANTLFNPATKIAQNEAWLNALNGAGVGSGGTLGSAIGSGVGSVLGGAGNAISGALGSAGSAISNGLTNVFGGNNGVGDTGYNIPLPSDPSSLQGNGFDLAPNYSYDSGLGGAAPGVNLGGLQTSDVSGNWGDTFDWGSWF